MIKAQWGGCRTQVTVAKFQARIRDLPEGTEVKHAL